MSDTPQAPADPADPAGAASTELEADAPPDAEPQPDELAETKRKFREVLDRKKQASAKDSTATGARGAGKAHGAGGRAASRREFRRKSG